MKRRNRNLFFNSSWVAGGDVLSSPLGLVLSTELVCMHGAGHLLCLGCRRSAYVWAQEEKCRLSALKSSRISCVSGASWSQEVKEQMLSVDCSFGLHLSLGIHKPLCSQHVTQLCASPHVCIKFLVLWRSPWKTHTYVHTCTHTHTHSLLLISPLTLNACTNFGRKAHFISTL